MQSTNIITPEQAGAKRYVWGTTEEILVNKNITREVKFLRRSLTTVWLICIGLIFINAISNLTDCWYTILNLQGKNDLCRKKSDF